MSQTRAAPSINLPKLAQPESLSGEVSPDNTRCQLEVICGWREILINGWASLGKFVVPPPTKAAAHLSVASILLFESFQNHLAAAMPQLYAIDGRQSRLQRMPSLELV